MTIDELAIAERSGPPPGVAHQDWIGSNDWACRWRLELGSLVKRLDIEPQRVAGWVRLGMQHRAWTKVHKEDGSSFASFEEFCETPQPFGLGRPFPEIRAHIEASVGKQAFQLEAVAPSQQGKRATSGTECRKSANADSERAQGKLRAILRAPEPIQVLYREGRISQTLAAKLGPSRKSPKKAAQIDKVVKQVHGLSDRKEIDKVVREVLGESKATALDQLKKFWKLASSRQKNSFLSWIEK